MYDMAGLIHRLDRMLFLLWYKKAQPKHLWSRHVVVVFVIDKSNYDSNIPFYCFLSFTFDVIFASYQLLGEWPINSEIDDPKIQRYKYLFMSTRYDGRVALDFNL